MALPSSGPISLGQVRTELKLSGPISLGQSEVRKLAKIDSGKISMNDLHGKQASEYVENYQVYSNSWFGALETGTFSIIFPYKIISGTLTVSSTFTIKEYDNLLGIGYVIVSGISIQQTTKQINVNNISSLICSYNTGGGKKKHDYGSGTRYVNGTVTVNVKFTGEWEAD